MLGDPGAYTIRLTPSTVPYVVFVGAVLIAYFGVAPRWRWVAVVVASVLFYLGWAAPGAVAGMLALVLLAHLSARAMRSRPRLKLLWCTVGVVGSIGTLAVLKYFDFFAAEAARLLSALGVQAHAPQLGLLLPVGYSFLVFSVTSYVVDVYRGKLEPAGLGELAAYLTFFPKLLAGPIERATHFLPQWRERLGFDSEKVVMGTNLILWGLFKKVVIADRLAPFVDRAYETPAFSTPIDLIVGTYFYAFQIYCDFSGYTDIAIGAILLFGIALDVNFHHPYLSRSVPEFWNSRWHISLGRWFRDYVYIPLGGNRRGRFRTYLNVMIVFVLSGIWHAGMVEASVGWNFALWGAINGAYVVLWNACSAVWGSLKARYPRLRRIDDLPGVYPLQALLTFHLILLSWVFFRAANIADAWTVITQVANNVGNLPMLARFYPFTSFEFVLSVGLIVFLLVVEASTDRRPLVDRLLRAPTAARWATGFVLAGALLVLGKWGTQTFIYMQF